MSGAIPVSIAPKYLQSEGLTLKGSDFAQIIHTALTPTPNSGEYARLGDGNATYEFINSATYNDILDELTISQDGDYNLHVQFLIDGTPYTAERDVTVAVARNTAATDAVPDEVVSHFEFSVNDVGRSKENYSFSDVVYLNKGDKLSLQYKIDDNSEQVPFTSVKFTVSKSVNDITG